MYTKIWQLKDKVKYLESIGNYSRALEVEKQAKKMESELRKECEHLNDLKVNLKAYIRNCLQILNRDVISTNQPRWQYYLEELDHSVVEQEHYYGTHTYHNYKYQVILMQPGKSELPLCTVDRQLTYGDEKEMLNLFCDKLHAPFSLRLDESCCDIDEAKAKALRLAIFKTIYEQQRKVVIEERTLIQQRISELNEKLKEQNKQYKTQDKQVQKFEKQIEKCFITKQ